MTEETKLTEETNISTKNDGLMGFISLIFGVGGIFLSYYFIFRYLGDILAAETDAAQECAATAPFFIPAFACIGIIGGILWLVAGVGYFQKMKWTYPVSVIAVIISLFASFWPNIPAMESKAAIPGPWFLIFFPNLLMYFYLVRSKGKVSRSKAWLGLLIGMAFILEFINGIAATTRMVNRLPDYGEASMYMLTMPTNMIASLLFGITVVGLFLSKRKDLVRTVGLGAAFLAIFSGFPLAFYSMFFANLDATFSMFIMGPVVSLLVGIVLLFPKMWNKIMGNNE
ncbi:hypothetical protein DSAG12_02931 [Promethearchaeum syntrophicum]|uniref:Uncharacterized protein n=1 Tax=Promethearchaeum syntrophicum TaxID=2594042 RepID=A0A5B9DCS0_9ARCH|nr:hypothetical protein [Candidatus Prometheoarchaeum syntrophicum]QEE17099.1 hypothetical protein DSAG12_02931 [Candidatus Prometheoarchaeum syntrophicum]